VFFRITCPTKRMANPDSWTLADAREHIVKPPGLDQNRAFYEGDHLHVGTGVSIGSINLGSLAGWIAPMPHPTDPTYRSAFDGVVRGFVSSNVTAQVVNRHGAGVVGRQPSKAFESKAPIPEGAEMPQELMRRKKMADAWMAECWESEGMHTSLQGAVNVLLYASRQPARLVLPSGFLEPGEKEGEWRIPQVSLEVMIKMLRLTYPRPEECTVYIDPDTFDQIGIFSYERDGDSRAELTWVDRATRLTIVRQVNQQGTLAQRVYDFGGLIPIYEMRRAALVTPQILQNQKALNLALSSVPRNVWSASARERYGFNIDPPGKETLVEGETVFEPQPIEVGSGSFNILNGYPIVDPTTGKVTGYTTPSMHVEDPVEVRPSKEAADIHTWEIHSEARQLHALTSTEAAQSGIKLLVARLDYTSSLTQTKPTVDGCLEWHDNTRLAMAEAFTGGREGRPAPHPYSSVLRANAECKLDPGPITPEERTALQALADAGTYSRETIRVLMGTEDAAEEGRKVATENRTKRILGLIREADELGMDRAAVLIHLEGMSTEEANALARGDVVTGLQQ
jgi:hypothetical protein